MILVDTNIWVDHFRDTDPLLDCLLGKGMVGTHPFILGELAMGNFRRRATIFDELSNLPDVRVCPDEEVMEFIETRNLFGRGLRFVDAHILAAVKLWPGTSLWTRDRRLRMAAEELGVAAKVLN
ncbi:type II toxin-antitoxin system VapC family toxin [Aerophototrophica crusticola]|uniref:Type II toxin-antitoxin system VapC family toxin n=1 Tax=Aerophototrophica crusticola TaxID=1709002 RepID=A0A858R2X1_9PROT|nr:type II toxin-antitoxin system VapC family toxin [Rhodospirillaceae bacterium B3]